MDSEVRRTIGIPTMVVLGIVAYLVGFLHGFGVGEREGQDMDASEQPTVEYSPPLRQGRAWGTNGD